MEEPTINAITRAIKCRLRQRAYNGKRLSVARDIEEADKGRKLAIFSRRSSA